MRIIDPFVENVDEEDILKKIEKCGRICYKSEDKITDDSAGKFVKNIIVRGHEAVLEHGTFILEVDRESYVDIHWIVEELEHEGFACFLRFSNFGRCIISGNVRAWRDFLKECVKSYLIPCCLFAFVKSNKVLFLEFQNGDLFGEIEHNKNCWANLMNVDDFLNGVEKEIHVDVTVKIVCDRGVSHEIVRHRVASFCQESTRYCNYTKDRFGEEITVIKHLMFDDNSPAYNIWKRSCENAEVAYFDLLNEGYKPQDARAVLPNSLKTEIAMTANLREWRHFLKLRLSEAAHPQMREIAYKILFLLNGKYPEVFEDI